MRKTVGNFEVDVWQGGYPIWIELKHGNDMLKFSHTELADLEYAVQAMRTAATQQLPVKRHIELK